MRVRTTNDNAGTARQTDLRADQNSAEQHGRRILVRMIKMLSLIIIGARSGLAIHRASPTNLSSKPNAVFHGIDFKNPFTMSNRRGVPLGIGRSRTDVFIIWNVVEQRVTAMPRRQSWLCHADRARRRAN